MISFNELNLEKNSKYKVIEFGGKEIKVSEYLPLSDKIDLINISLQNSKNVDGGFDLVKLNAEFYLNILMMYTDITFFDEDQVYDRYEIYDIAASSGLLDKVLEAIDENEFKEIYNFMEKQKEETFRYNTSMVSLVKTSIETLPKNMENVMGMLKGFDAEGFKKTMAEIQQAAMNLGKEE